MFFNFPKTVIVLFVCLSFVGQATASAVLSYQMVHMSGNHTQKQVQNMAGTSHLEHASHDDHASHDVHAMMSDISNSMSDSTDNCCSKNCSCFANGCSSALSFIIDTSTNAHFTSSEKILSNNDLILNQQSTSLFKPPITA
jgi:hypothetical protein